MNGIMNVPEPVPYTIRIGVTGHRDLKQPAEVEQKVATIINKIVADAAKGMSDPYQPGLKRGTKWFCMECKIAAKFKHFMASMKVLPNYEWCRRETPVKITVFSALAKGADRIVAKVAMENYNASLKAVMPFDLGEYRKDFKTKPDLDEFNELFDQADNKDDFKESGTNISEDFCRREGYSNAGIEVVENCDILFAIWDGKPARGVGGTAEIVGYAAALKRHVIWINSDNPDDVKELKSIEKENNGTILPLTEKLPKDFIQWLPRCLDVAEYNRDRAFSQKIFERSATSNRNRNIAQWAIAGLQENDLTPLLNKLLPHYSYADTLANVYKKKHMRAAMWIYRLAAFSVAVAVIQIFFFEEHSFIIAFEILALLLAMIWYRVSHVEKWHEKWLNYRHLAERLRILTYTSILKKPTEKPVLAGPLPFYPGPGGWVLDVFDTIKSEVLKIDVNYHNINSVKNFIRDSWITYQKDWHTGQTKKKKKNSHKEKTAITIMLAFTLFAGLIHLFDPLHNNHLNQVIVIIVVILPAIATAQHAIGQIKDEERIAARSEGMSQILGAIENNLNKDINEESLLQEINLAEEVMSTEIHEWCVSLAFKRIDRVPV